eukprot:CAMPEP_0169250908 /NCGR_PEP_ID=MMETSP1016-20121227/37222_1 /TAXON_ID=342587 /ORGANISM="Karlodinium micrum, Strain CCMP2283" /LENGTH=117 /DNA_ID=CAMNT_0009331993 /DNA_START=76 /DNA_END=426 /DNA_ORIENTATION=-
MSTTEEHPESQDELVPTRATTVFQYIQNLANMTVTIASENHAMQSAGEVFISLINGIIPLSCHSSIVCNAFLIVILRSKDKVARRVTKHHVIQVCGSSTPIMNCALTVAYAQVTNHW